MKKRIISVFILVCILLVGCAKETDDAVNISTTTAVETPEVEETVTLTESEVVVTPEVELVLPLTENTTRKVQIQTVSGVTAYSYNSYIITSSNGESVVVDPNAMPSKDIVDINPAAIVSTHGHPDHIDSDYTDSYDCQKIFYTKDDINTEDFHIYTIYSSHSGDKISDDNVIIVFEVDGLRIAHMGDIGQSALTEDQLKELGEIDIAFMQFENSYSAMTLINQTGFNMIEQLNPKLVIPTHYTYKTIAVLEEKYGTITEVDNVLAISKEELPETPLTVYRIINKHKYR
ncbi:MAG: beta-lactamase domain protein [Clostridiales bacterium]|jgi:hypothetical protein|nr:beta-lactamase domain protein [Clostridiales bacterium]